MGWFFSRTTHFSGQYSRDIYTFRFACDGSKYNDCDGPRYRVFFYIYIRGEDTFDQIRRGNNENAFSSNLCCAARDGRRRTRSEIYGRTVNVERRVRPPEALRATINRFRISKTPAKNAALARPPYDSHVERNGELLRRPRPIVCRPSRANAYFFFVCKPAHSDDLGKR